MLVLSNFTATEGENNLFFFGAKQPVKDIVVTSQLERIQEGYH